MCYTGACEYESYPWGYNEGCVCRKPQYAPCPHEEEDEVENPCPHCGKEMAESLITDNAGGSHRERDAWYCEDCDYTEAAE